MRKQMHLVKNQSFKKIKRSQELYLDIIVMEKSDMLKQAVVEGIYARKRAPGTGTGLY